MYSSHSVPEHLAALQPGLRLHLLGSPTITWNDSPLVIPRRSVRALLYRLACETEPVARVELHLLFWPDMPEGVARRNLSHHLTHLRRALPSTEVLKTTGDRVWLEPGLMWSDVIEYKTVTQGLLEDSARLHHLVTLYRGSFLEGFDLSGCPDFEHWCLVERVSLERKYLKVLELLVESCTYRGEVTRALNFMQRYLEIDPLSEVMHQRLIQFFAASGERHLALKQFERCSSILKAELGVSPLPETQAIYQAVLFGQHRFNKPSITPTPQLLDMWSPLIGREDELRIMENAFLRMQAHCSQVVLISGEAGIGKSCLMQEFIKNHQGDVRLLYGMAVSGGQAIPYQPLLDALRTMLGLYDIYPDTSSDRTLPIAQKPYLIEPVWLSEISRLLPDLHTAYPDLPPALPVESEVVRTRLFDALSQLVLAYSRINGPIIFCLDDLQWMDAATLAWLVHIIGYLKQSDYPVLILGLYLSEEEEQVQDLRHALVHAKMLTELRLTGLNEANVLILMQNLLGKRTGDELFAARLHQATGGNPFYLVEILRKLTEDGETAAYDQSAALFSLPESIREAVQIRVKRLSPLARQVLEAGAVLGQNFSIDLLRLTAGRSHVEVMTALDELVARIFLVESLQGYRFVHQLTCQYVEASLGQGRKQLLHRRAGRAYQRLDSSAFTSLAFHFDQGVDYHKAVHYHAQAAQQAQALCAWHTVEFHQGRILDLLDLIDAGYKQLELIRQKGDILAEMAHVRYLLGKIIERDHDLTALSELAEFKDDDQLRLQALLHRMRYLNLDGHYIEAKSCAKAGLKLVRSSPAFVTDQEDVGLLQSRLLAQLGFAHYFLGEPQEALAVLEDARALCRKHTDPDSCGRIHHVLGYIYFHLGDHTLSLECQQQAYACHLKVGDTNRIAWDLFDIGAAYKNLGNLAESQHFFDEGLELSRRIGAQQAEAYGLTHIGSLKLYHGDYTAANAYYKQVLEMQPNVQSEHIIATAEAGLGLALYHLGDYIPSRSWVERALQRARGTGHRRRWSQSLNQLGLLDLVEGSLPIARQHLEDGLALARHSHSGECLAIGLGAMAQLERMAGNPLIALGLAVQGVSAAHLVNLLCCEMWCEIEAGLARIALDELTPALEHTGRSIHLASRASQDWIGREQAFQAHALVLRAMHQEHAAEAQEAFAREVIQAKADLIMDPIQRQRFLSKPIQL